jgi:hypothetical protein
VRFQSFAAGSFFGLESVPERHGSPRHFGIRKITQRFFPDVETV